MWFRPDEWISAHADGNYKHAVADPITLYYKKLELFFAQGMIRVPSNVTVSHRDFTYIVKLLPADADMRRASSNRESVNEDVLQ